ncbi:MAG: family 16 glycoside hydrolase [Planctomycetota bacterium]
MRIAYASVPFVAVAFAAIILLPFATAAQELAQAEATQWEAGADLRVYSIGTGLGSLPDLLESQTPNYNVKISTLDLDGERGDFGTIRDHFYTTITARLRLPTAGEYKFRLTSDDGSALTIDGKSVLDHDGLHGPTAVEGSVTLAAGYCQLAIEHFENGGGEMVRLEWQQPGAEEFSVLDAEHLTTPAGWVRVTSPGTKKVRGPSDAPGDGRPLTAVHPSYTVMQARPDSFRPKVGGLDILGEDRLVVCCWEPDGGVYILDDYRSGDPEGITVTKFAEGLAEPLGLCVVEDRIFVLQKQELTELIDYDNDGIADEYVCISDRWPVTSNFHEFAFGLVHVQGWLYFNLAIAIDPGGKSTQPQAPNRGRTARVQIETGRTRFISSGLRTPNGIGYASERFIYIADNQGDWLPCSKIIQLRRGDFYGSRAALPKDWQEKAPTPPVVWMPQNEIGNSPAEISEFRGGLFHQHLAVCDVTHGGIKRIFLEDVKGVRQGALFRFTQGLEAGINRMKVLPDDGTILVGGIGSGGNWGQTGKLSYGLQQLVPTGPPTFEMQAVRIRSNGFLVEFTKPVDPSSLPPLTDFRCQLYRYVPTAEYGGPKVDLRNLTPQSVSLSKDRRQLFVEIPEIPTDHVFYLRLPSTLRSQRHEALWSTEVWYTINRVPEGKVHTPWPAATRRPHNELTVAEKRTGWQLLFDGTQTSQWRGYKQADFPSRGWHAEDGCLKHDAGGGGGDIITRERYDNFDFQCEWRIAPAGNSGIMILVNEGDGPTYTTGPEMQVYDDYHWQPNAKTASGSLYDLVPCDRDVSRPAGEWNHVRIKLHNRRLEQWFNGVRVVAVELHSKRWEQLVAASKFATMPNFAKKLDGHIALQDHGDEVWYRNLKIRRLPSTTKKE